MANITKREFATLDITGSNYLTWAFDVKIHLTSLDLDQSILAKSNCTPAQKAKALIFIRHHLHEDLKAEYLIEEDPAVLWQSLKDRFDHQQEVVLPHARFEWINLRFQDFKSVAEYNSAIQRIVSLLRLCGQQITETEMLEKTLSTFHANNLILQQQYRAKNYAKHSELISALLVAEKHNQLLMQNHNSRPTGSAPMPEAHGTRHKNKSYGHWKGKRRNFKNQPYKSRDRGSQGPKQGPQRKEGPEVPNRVGANICHRCGSAGHWSRTCRTPKHLVDLYRREQDERKREANVATKLPMENKELSLDHPSLDNTSFDIDHFLDLE